MSSTSFDSGKFPRSRERRLFIRQRVRSLAYFDVGPDNGGMVLNLSENGLALQAANPFIGQTRVSLHIQLPTSRKRIETSAEITWLSESKKEAGLRFLELSDDVRVELADWISAEADTAEERPLDDSASPLRRPVPSKLEIESPTAADPIAKRHETPDAPLRELNSTLRQSLAGRFRKWWAIAALCGCTTLVFLFLGMAFTRGLLHDRFGKSSVDERARTANAAPASPVAPGPLSLGAGSQSGASASKTRHIDAGKVARASRVEDPGKRNDENPQPDSRHGEIDSPVAKLSSPIDSVRPNTKSDSQNVSVPSGPVLSVQPSDAHNPTVDPPAVKAASPASADRRNDCYLIYRVEPLYPREAKEQHIEGTVTIHLLIGTDGRVRSLRELSGPGSLVPAALAAAEDWRFVPALLNGVPVDAEQDVTIVFRLPH
jgi:TonB family protein